MPRTPIEVEAQLKRLRALIPPGYSPAPDDFAAELQLAALRQHEEELVRELEAARAESYAEIHKVRTVRQRVLENAKRIFRSDADQRGKGRMGATANTASLIEQISGLTLLETSELIKALETKLGVNAAAPVAAAAPAGGGAVPTEEKTSFDVILTDMGGNKIAVIKEVRVAVAGLGLVEAKALVEGAPKPIKEGIPKAEAEEIKKKIEAAGARVEIR